MTTRTEQTNDLFQTATLHYKSGVALEKQRQYEAAIQAYSQAIAIYPDYPNAHYNKANVLMMQGKLTEAVASYQQALFYKPDFAYAHCNMGSALADLNQPKLAIASYRQALTYLPDDGEIHFNLGLLLLVLGEYAEGWREHEYRYHPSVDNPNIKVPTLSFPQWQGQSLSGKSIVIWYEQGLGDMIQFCRYAAVLKQHYAAKVTIVCDSVLKSLLESLPDVDGVCAKNETSQLGLHDYWTFAMSIPLYCQTSLETIPAVVPYLFANEQLSQKIASELQPIREFKVGVCWKGNPQFKTDAERSPGIAWFQPLFKLSGVKFFNLQPDTRQEFLLNAGQNGVDRGHEIDKSSFAESAALIASLDLVISSCTSICHVAGALGKPVWIVLPFVADWRWLIEREDSPWYPTVRLFRQTKQGDWGGVFERVTKQLQILITGEQQAISTEIKSAEQPDFAQSQLLAETFQTAMQQHQSGNLAQADTLYRQILQQDPNHVDALHFLGVLAYQVGQSQAAVDLISKAIQQNSSSCGMYCNLGLALQALDKLDAAIESYQKAIALQPDYADAYYNLGNAQHAQGHLDGAIASYRQALALNPNFAVAQTNLGNVFKQQNNLEAAISNYLAAIATQPDYVQAHYNLGIAQQELGKYPLALASYQQALSIQPDYPEAHSALGLLQLTLGQFQQGWQHYEARYDVRVKNRSTFAPNVQIPQWQGESLRGKSLLIWNEQGLGDEIQFCRYASLLKAQGAKQITWVCKKSLKSLIQTLKAIDNVVTVEEATLINRHDYWAFPLSLPLHCQTTLANIPATVPYLSANPKQVAAIAKELRPIKEFKIGVCWKGSPLHKNDSNRSPGISAFKPLFAMSGIKFFNLQPDTREEFCREAGKNAVDRGREIDKSSFDEAAALIMNLDLVISCDTSICHLAGALGKPVWIVLPQLTIDWRWLLEREDSPWYPSVRLFRQARQGNWDEVFQRVAKQLPEIMAEQNQPKKSLLGKLFAKKSPTKVEATKPTPLVDFSVADAFSKALQIHQMGDLVQAEVLYRQILQHQPNHADALHFSGVLAYQSGHYARAVELINQAIAVYPSIAMYSNLANIFQAQGKTEQLIQTYQQALLLENNAEMQYKVANLLQSLGRLDEAINHYQQALLLNPDAINVLNNLGVALQAQAKFDEAIVCFQKTLAQNPEFANAYNNLGIIFQTQKRLEEAAQVYNRAIALNPDYVEAHHNLANTLQLQGKLDEAVAHYEKTIALNPNISEVQNSLGLLLLKMGRLMAGWQYCESRYREDINEPSTVVPKLSFPQWQGESLQEKSLLIWYEQGLGDEIQFCRYVSVLKARGAKRITWVCKKPLKSLLKTMPDVDMVLAAEEKSLIKPHDYWTFALSVPLHCQTTLETIPAIVPYLYPNSEQRDKIASELCSITGLKVGICWKGNPNYKADAERSPGIVPFKPLFQLSGVKFFNLQPDTRQEFLANAGQGGVDRGHEIDKSSFDEAAALITNMDLVISSDTSICHLAAALGKAVWIVLPYTADWRWLLEREDCPWYPNARLFRQTNAGDWREVFQRVETCLQHMIADKK